MSLVKYHFPETYQSWIQAQLEPRNHSLDKPRELAKQILKLSDIYTKKRQDKIPNIWKDKALTSAYLSYFFPLNYLRSLAVINEFKNWPLNDSIQSILDYGSGPGVFLQAFLDQLPELQHAKLNALDQTNDVHQIHQDLHHFKHRTQAIHFHTEESQLAAPDLLLSSYAINELDKMPIIFDKAKVVIIIEPSLAGVTRQLMASREAWIKKGFQIVAPCLHHDNCPLLTHSKSDWCHNRIFIDPPEWFKLIEQHLPIKNPTLTYSYLILSKQKINKDANSVRVIGDLQSEKGKYKQAVCRNQEREFFTWLKKDYKQKPQDNRGLITKLPINITKKSNELRISK